MEWVLTFVVLGAFALVAIVFDFLAIRRHVGWRWPWVSIGLKAFVLVLFGTVWAYFGLLEPAEGADPYAWFQNVLFFAIPVLTASAAVDFLVLRALRTPHRRQSGF